ncbi:hypothetical protein [Pseudonocardia sp. ICBG1293]
MVRDIKAEPGGSAKGACRRVGDQLGINPETLQGWVNQAEIDDGDRPGVSTGRAQAVEAFASMSSLNTSEGFFQSKILRGRSLMSLAIMAR